jgi:FtsP/CotA-like multicopper oxidase with cupredoxin domain
MCRRGVWIALGLLSAFAPPLLAQSFRVQCPSSTITHPVAGNNNSEPVYAGPTQQAAGPNGYLVPDSNTVNGAIKCQQISGGDGYATMGDGTQSYLFSFGPLSGLGLIASGQPGTEFPNDFNNAYPASFNPGTNVANRLLPGDPATTIDGTTAGNASGGFIQPLSGTQTGEIPKFYNGAVGLMGDQTVSTPSVGGVQATATANIVNAIVGSVTINNAGHGYFGPVSVTFPPPPPPADPNSGTALGTVQLSSAGTVTGITITFAGEGYTGTSVPVTISAPVTSCAGAQPNSSPDCLTGHVDPREIMDVGVMNGNIPAPLFAIDEDDEFFLTLTNVGMIMRPDLFEQHTVHFHGYPNASAFYDGVPDASVAINIAASFTYYYLAPDAGTYFWHCHITPPEHLQMGMVGQLYVRPRQDRVAVGRALYAARQQQDADPRTACVSANDILCSNPLPAANGVPRAPKGNYAYNDGDGSTYYDAEYPIQMHGFDPNFHFVGMTFNPEGFADMKDKYFLLNGRSYPDTVNPDPLQTQSADGVYHFSQPLPTIITIPHGGRALLRISNLNVSEYQTLGSLGVPMLVVGYNAKLLRDQAGNNLYYTTNSITLGGGESLDVILDACTVARVDPSATCTAPMPAGTYYLYTPNLDHLSNDAENFGGQMTEVHVL